MKNKMHMFVVAITVGIVSCGPEAIGEETGGNAKSPMRLVYEFDDCKMYEFTGKSGYTHYVTHCETGSVSVSGR